MSSFFAVIACIYWVFELFLEAICKIFMHIDFANDQKNLAKAKAQIRQFAEKYAATESEYNQVIWDIVGKKPYAVDILKKSAEDLGWDYVTLRNNSFYARQIVLAYQCKVILEDIDNGIVLSNVDSGWMSDESIKREVDFYKYYDKVLTEHGFPEHLRLLKKVPSNHKDLGMVIPDINPQSLSQYPCIKNLNQFASGRLFWNVTTVRRHLDILDMKEKYRTW